MSGATLVCGMHAVRSAIEAAPARAIRLLIDNKRRDKRMQTIIDLSKAHSIPIEYAGRDELDTKVAGRVHQGIVLISKAAKVHDENDLQDLLAGANQPPLVLVLDGVTDPHNLGACLRTADAAGVDFAIVPKDRAAGLTATVRKSASGAAERLPLVRVTNLARTLKQLQAAGLWITGASISGQYLYKADLTGPRIIVMGGEATGMRRLTRVHCDQLVSIPMAGGAESLNVSVAAGIVLYEAVRQRSAAAVQCGTGAG